MLLRESLTRLMNRLRYPVSLPDDIANDLGISLPRIRSLKVFLELLSMPATKTKHLKRWMPRHEAEAAFKCAIKKETFSASSFFSYYFNHGWVVVALYFDEHARLRRAYLQCPACETMEGFELKIDEESCLNALLKSS